MIYGLPCQEFKFTSIPDKDTLRPRIGITVSNKQDVLLNK